MLQNQQQKQLWNLCHWSLLRKQWTGISQKSFGVPWHGPRQKSSWSFWLLTAWFTHSHTALPTPTLEKSLDWKTNIVIPVSLVCRAQTGDKTCWKCLRWTLILLMPESGLIPTRYGSPTTRLLCFALLLLQNTDMLRESQSGGKTKIAHCSPAAHQSVAFLSLSLSPPPSPF